MCLGMLNDVTQLVAHQSSSLSMVHSVEVDLLSSAKSRKQTI